MESGEEPTGASPHLVTPATKKSRRPHEVDNKEEERPGELGPQPAPQGEPQPGEQPEKQSESEPPNKGAANMAQVADHMFHKVRIDMAKEWAFEADNNEMNHKVTNAVLQFHGGEGGRCGGVRALYAKNTCYGDDRTKRIYKASARHG